MLSSCACETADDEVSLSTASLVSICVIAGTSLLFGVILGMGWMFTSGMLTADHEQLGFALVLTGIMGFFLTMVIAIVRNERKRARLMVIRQNGY
jgi:hypothetical protein